VTSLAEAAREKIEKDFNELILEPFAEPDPPTGLVPPTDLADPDSKFVTVRVRGESVDVHYKERLPPPGRSGGESSSSSVDALVCLHGANGSEFSFRNLLPRVAAESGVRAVAFDRPPYGLSSRPALPPASSSDDAAGGANFVYTPEGQAELTLAVMDALGIRKAALLGHSAGAPVALDAACAAPERCPELVFVAPRRLPGRRRRRRRLSDAPSDARRRSSSNERSRGGDLRVRGGVVETEPPATLSSAPPTRSSRSSRGGGGGILRLPLDRALRFAWFRFLISRDSTGLNVVRGSVRRQTAAVEEGRAYPDLPADVRAAYVRPTKTVGWDEGLLQLFRGGSFGGDGAEKARRRLPRLADAGARAVVVVGTEDRTTPPALAEGLRDALVRAGVRDVRFERLRGGGHLPMEQEAGGVRDAFERVVAETLRATTPEPTTGGKGGAETRGDDGTNDRPDERKAEEMAAGDDLTAEAKVVKAADAPTPTPTPTPEANAADVSRAAPTTTEGGSSPGAGALAYEYSEARGGGEEGDVVLRDDRRRAVRPQGSGRVQGGDGGRIPRRRRRRGGGALRGALRRPEATRHAEGRREGEKRRHERRAGHRGVRHGTVRVDGRGEGLVRGATARRAVTGTRKCLFVSYFRKSLSRVITFSNARA
jgi:pimeloyl-ACP methyl ester carboxylesterase